MKATIAGGVVYSPYPDVTPIKESTIFALLKTRNKCYGEKVALICEGERITHSQVLERLQWVASIYQSNGIGRGDRVCAHISNGIDEFIAVCAITLTGATLVTSDVLFKEGELLAHMKNTDTTHVLTDATYAPLFSKITLQHKIKAIFSMDDVPGAVFLFNKNNPHDCKYTEPEGSLHNVIIMSHTSGTTGTSKIMEVDENRFLLQMCCRQNIGILAPEDVAVGGGNISFYFFFSFVFNILTVGATIILLKSTDVLDLYETCKINKVTLMNGTPQKMLKIAEAFKKSGFKLPCLKKLRTQGMILPERIAQEVVSALAPSELRDCYGMTEVSGYLAVPPNGEISKGDVGFPVSNTKMKIVHTETRRLLGPLQRGEVLFQSPYVMKGYYKTPKATSSFIDSEGWIHTGDLGYYNHDGRLFLVGRIKSTMFRLGKHINPSDIEQCLYGHPSVAEAAVLPLKRHDTDDDPAAIIVPKHGVVADGTLAEEIRTFVAERLAPYKHLHGGIYFTHSIPKTSFGKVKRKLLQDLVLSLKRMDHEPS